jgi:hypothetical protein
MPEKISLTWQTYNKNLDEVKIDNIYEALRTGYLVRTISGEGSVATKEINLLRKDWDLNDLSVIEIGGGYGAYCKEFHKWARVKDYTIVDTKSMMRFAKAYLEAENIPCTFIDTEGELPDKHYDLLISNVCISEIPEAHAKEMLGKLFKQVQRVAIIDDGMDWLENMLRENFEVISKTSCPESNQTINYLYKARKI